METKDYKWENRTIKSVKLTSENGRNARVTFELDGEPFKSFDFKTGEEIETINPGKQGQTVKINIPVKCEKNWILRRKK